MLISVHGHNRELNSANDGHLNVFLLNGDSALIVVMDYKGTRLTD